MDTFDEPYTRPGHNISLDAVRQQVRVLEDAHRAHGVQLSGRIVHVCHFLPIVPSLIPSNAPPKGLLSPPPTPPVVPDDVPPSPSDESSTAGVAVEQAESQERPKRWKLAPRYGHSAMFSGIRSLSETHDQLIVGWAGDVFSAPNTDTSSSEEHVTGDRVPGAQVTKADRDALEAELACYHEDGSEGKHKIEYLPVWLEDKVAHAHYDGYCKSSECRVPPISIFVSILFL